MKHHMYRPAPLPTDYRTAFRFLDARIGRTATSIRKDIEVIAKSDQQWVELVFFVIADGRIFDGYQPDPALVMTREEYDEKYP